MMEQRWVLILEFMHMHRNCLAEIKISEMSSTLLRQSQGPSHPNMPPAISTPKRCKTRLVCHSISPAFRLPSVLVCLECLLHISRFRADDEKAFTGTGDFVRGRNLAILGELLDRGVKVAMMYGDSDYQCNCEFLQSSTHSSSPMLTGFSGLGGERISLAIESKISPAFQKAGYADILVNDTYSGGSVRQYGNLSFSRVYGAGHEGKVSTISAPSHLSCCNSADLLQPAVWYQPETGYQIFNRVMADVDVATGKLPTVGLPTYSSTGPASVFSIKNALPDNPPSECYFWDIMETCTPAQAKRFNNGTAVMKDFVMIGYVLDNGTAVHY